MPFLEVGQKKTWAKSISVKENSCTWNQICVLHSIIILSRFRSWKCFSLILSCKILSVLCISWIMSMCEGVSVIWYGGGGSDGSVIDCISCSRMMLALSEMYKRGKKQSSFLGSIAISTLLQIWAKTIHLHWIGVYSQWDSEGVGKNVQVGQESEQRSMCWLDCLYYQQEPSGMLMCSGHRLHITEGGFCAHWQNLVSSNNVEEKKHFKTRKARKSFSQLQDLSQWVKSRDLCSLYPVGFAGSPLINPITRRTEYKIVFALRWCIVMQEPVMKY